MYSTQYRCPLIIFISNESIIVHVLYILCKLSGHLSGLGVIITAATKNDTNNSVDHQESYRGPG